MLFVVHVVEWLLVIIKLIFFKVVKTFSFLIKKVFFLLFAELKIHIFFVGKLLDQIIGKGLAPQFIIIIHFLS